MPPNRGLFVLHWRPSWALAFRPSRRACRRMPYSSVTAPTGFRLALRTPDARNIRRGRAGTPSDRHKPPRTRWRIHFVPGGNEMRRRAEVKGHVLPAFIGGVVSGAIPQLTLLLPGTRPRDKHAVFDAIPVSVRSFFAGIEAPVPAFEMRPLGGVSGPDSTMISNEGAWSFGRHEPAVAASSPRRAGAVTVVVQADIQLGDIPRKRSDRRRSNSTVVRSAIETATRMVATARMVGLICSRSPVNICQGSVF